RSAHVGGKLVDFIHSLDDSFGNSGISEVANDELVSGTSAEFVMLQIDAANPGAGVLQPSHEMSADKSTGPTHQYPLCLHMLSQSDFKHFEVSAGCLLGFIE